LNRRLEKLSKELHRPYPVGSSTLFPPGHQDNSMAATLWHQMKLGEDDRVSLPQVRTMLLFVGLEEPSVDALEVSIAEADNHLTGPTQLLAVLLDNQMIVLVLPDPTS
jgi:hypothetical protein